jgi:hypothetical protein
VPLWFCVACPAVLGLLAPLVINAGLGAAACRHWQLPAEECNDLWYVIVRMVVYKACGCALDPGSLVPADVCRGLVQSSAAMNMLWSVDEDSQM